MERKNDFILFKFTRKLINCYPNPNDFSIDILGEDLNLVYLWGDVFVEHDIVYNQGNKGTRLVNFMSNFVPRANECALHRNAIVRSSFESYPNEEYANFAELKKELFRLHWNVTDTKIIIEVHVKTTGWVSFGFSPDGSMFDSDIFVGWISNGSHNFTVSYILIF